MSQTPSPIMRCIAIDDEPLALSQMTAYIERTPFLTLVAGCRSAFDAASLLATQDVDLLLVDINMPDLNGMDFVKSLVKKPLVVFTTAYSEYAIEGFRVDAIDYLLKPIGYPDFLRAVDKAYRQYRLLTNVVPVQEAAPEFIFVKSQYKIIQIRIEDILYIESRSEYLRICTEDGEAVMTLGNMKSMEEKLPTDTFMRIHRSFIVNLRKITAVERTRLTLGPKTHITVGEQYKEVFKDYLAKHSLIK